SLPTSSNTAALIFTPKPLAFPRWNGVKVHLVRIARKAF
ncbi:MAG: hypothetical protein RL193_837, partial [Actinomycetota bacterium]